MKINGNRGSSQRRRIKVHKGVYADHKSVSAGNQNGHVTGVCSPDQIAAGTAAGTTKHPARKAPRIFIGSRPIDKKIYICSRAVKGKMVRGLAIRLFVGWAVGWFGGCGAKDGAGDDTSCADAIKTPATVEEAARVLDLSTFPLIDTAKPTDERHVANLSYLATGDVKTAFEFNQKALL